MTNKFGGFEKPTKANTINVPEAFFTQVVTHENASVIKIVCYFLTRTVQGQVEIKVSYAELAKATGLSRCGVHSGLQGAIGAGYIQVVKVGDNASSSAYALCWREDNPVKDSGDNNPPSHQSTNQPEPIISTYPDKKIACQDSRIIESEIELIESVNPLVRKKADHPPGYPQIPANFPQNGDKPKSAYLTNLTADFSRELGDLSHIPSNCTQTHNLWYTSRLSEKEFAEQMYTARTLTRRYAVLRPGETHPPQGQKRNQMAYFYTVLRNQIGSGTPIRESYLLHPNRSTNKQPPYYNRA